MIERVTVSIDRELAQAFDEYCRKRGYQSRSEAVRDLLRERLMRAGDEGEDDHCVAILAYVYNHDKQNLSRRLVEEHHSHHHLEIATLHVHMDHDNCLEAVILRGLRSQVEQFADRVISRRSVRYGHLQVIPARVELQEHPHDHGPDAGDVEPHTHLTPER